MVIGIGWAAVVLLFAPTTAPETPHHLKEQQGALIFSDENHKIPLDVSKLSKGDVAYFSDWAAI
jgi:hypothetical protein